MFDDARAISDGESRENTKSSQEETQTDQPEHGLGRSTAAVVAFPANRVRGLIRETAATIIARPTKSEWHRRHAAGRVWAWLMLAGIDRAHIGKQVAAFDEALDAELHRQAVLDALRGRQDSGDAA
jgi:hypothetical protein